MKDHLRYDLYCASVNSVQESQLWAKTLLRELLYKHKNKQIYVILYSNQAFKLLFSHITLAVSQQKPLFLSLPKFNRCWYPSSLFCLFCLRLKFTRTCCLAAPTCVYVGVHLKKIVSSYFISGYQQSRYTKALLIFNYWSNDERPCLSLFFFFLFFLHEEKIPS